MKVISKTLLISFLRLIKKYVRKHNAQLWLGMALSYCEHKYFLGNELGSF